MKATLLLLFFLMIATLSYPRMRQQYYWGIKGGVALPSNIGRNSDNPGFADVAAAGINGALKAGWFYNQRLSLSVEGSYIYFPNKSSFWDVGTRGNIEANYQVSGILISGCYYMSDEDWRPYAGMNFGINYIRNMVSFKSRYVGTDNDASVKYLYSDWRPGFGAAVGTSVKITSKTEFCIEASGTIIPFLKEKTVPIKEDGVIVDYVTENPHGNQNHFLITIGINFML